MVKFISDLVAEYKAGYYTNLVIINFWLVLSVSLSPKVIALTAKNLSDFSFTEV
jgi:hypothetical protein